MDDWAIDASLGGPVQRLGLDISHPEGGGPLHNPMSLSEIQSALEPENVADGVLKKVFQELEPPALIGSGTFHMLPRSALGTSEPGAVCTAC